MVADDMTKIVKTGMEDAFNEITLEVPNIRWNRELKIPGVI